MKSKLGYCHWKMRTWKLYNPQLFAFFRKKGVPSIDRHRSLNLSTGFSLCEGDCCPATAGDSPVGGLLRLAEVLGGVGEASGGFGAGEESRFKTGPDATCPVCTVDGLAAVYEAIGDGTAGLED